jgi:hypothetical protein
MVASVGSTDAGNEALAAAYKPSSPTTAPRPQEQAVRVEEPAASAEAEKSRTARPEEPRDAARSTPEPAKPDPKAVVYSVENRGGAEAAAVGTKPESPLGLVVNLYA